VATTLNNTWHSSVNPDWKCAFLPLASIWAQDYIAETVYCIDFAKKNRMLMLNVIQGILGLHFDDINYKPLIDTVHNFVSKEKHFGKDVYVHRKGSVEAGQHKIVVIPGSQGTNSFVCKGLGNYLSLNSCSHGAGRRLSREQAKKILDLATEQAKLNNQGIVHCMKTQDDIDESASCYKDIVAVMKNQADLVTPIIKLSPVCVIKG
jgi:tRNA-splicing ligase RtcB (3'-phosphate/5'-hydroxy nucleic acid ligase)